MGETLAILHVLIQVIWQAKAICVSLCKGLQYNAHLLVMAMDYCIVFCLWSPLISFLLLCALCNFICPLRSSCPFSWALIFNKFGAFSQLQNKLLNFCWYCPRFFLQWKMYKQAWNDRFYIFYDYNDIIRHDCPLPLGGKPPKRRISFHVCLTGFTHLFSQTVVEGKTLLLKLWHASWKNRYLSQDDQDAHIFFKFIGLPKVINVMKKYFKMEPEIILECKF